MPRALNAVLALSLGATPALAQTMGPDQVEPEAFSPAEVEAAAKDPKKYTLDPASVRFSKVDAKEPIPGLPPPPSVPDSSGIDIGRIINIAKEIWAFIEKNQPVTDITTSYGTAVPAGITHWSQLTGWKEPEGTVYGFNAKNGYGMEVVNVRYQVLRTWGGSYNGKGKYLTNVTVKPLRATVAWGYRLNMNVEIPSVTNEGTAEAPLAAMLMNVGWSIKTIIKNDTGTSVYSLKGDGAYREMGGPFEKGYQERTEKALERIRPPAAPSGPRPDSPCRIGYPGLC